MKHKATVIMLIGILVLSAFSVAIGTDDPLITESYLNDVFLTKVKEYINSNSDGGNTFKVLSVTKDSKFIGDSGCEFILRQGKGTVVSARLGGLTDTTAGLDITGGTEIPPNHLLIVPRDDGRGFIALTDVVIMVKGKYEIK